MESIQRKLKSKEEEERKPRVSDHLGNAKARPPTPTRISAVSLQLRAEFRALFMGGRGCEHLLPVCHGPDYLCTLLHLVHASSLSNGLISQEKCFSFIHSFNLSNPLWRDNSELERDCLPGAYFLAQMKTLAQGHQLTSYLETLRYEPR